MKNICTEQKALPRGTAGQGFLRAMQRGLRERRRRAAMRIGRRRRSMNAYVTVDGVKMTRLSPEGGVPKRRRWRLRQKLAGGPAVRPHASGHQNALPANFSRFARALLMLCPLKQKKDTRKCILLFWSGRRGSNSLPRPWQGRALPDELRPHSNGYYKA